MKKSGTSSTAAQNYKAIEWYSVEKALEGKTKNEKRVDIPLAEGCKLSIFESNKDYDFGNINLFGFYINVTFRNGKNGMFMSFPSTKTQKGDYADLAGCFDKSFHTFIKELLEAYYA